MAADSCSEYSLNVLYMGNPGIDGHLCTGITFDDVDVYYDFTLPEIRDG